MKKLFTILALLLSTNAFSQDLDQAIRVDVQTKDENNILQTETFQGFISPYNPFIISYITSFPHLSAVEVDRDTGEENLIFDHIRLANVFSIENTNNPTYNYSIEINYIEFIEQPLSLYQSIIRKHSVQRHLNLEPYITQKVYINSNTSLNITLNY